MGMDGSDMLPAKLRKPKNRCKGETNVVHVSLFTFLDVFMSVS